LNIDIIVINGHKTGIFLAQNSTYLAISHAENNVNYCHKWCYFQDKTTLIMAENNVNYCHKWCYFQDKTTLIIDQICVIISHLQFS
jgi:hypothetical protein